VVTVSNTAVALALLVRSAGRVREHDADAPGRPRGDPE
jgi:hypothetical protein